LHITILDTLYPPIQLTQSDLSIAFSVKNLGEFKGVFMGFLKHR